MISNKRHGISVLIPAYNEKESLRIAIQTVLKQSYRPIEIVIADDSTDGRVISLEEIEAIEKSPEVVVSYYKNPQNLGFYRNYRNGLGKLNYPYFIFFQHDDVLIDSDFFSRAIECLHKYSQVSCYVANAINEETNTLMMNSSNAQIGIINRKKFLKNLWKSYHTSHSAIIHDYEVLSNLQYSSKFLADSDLRHFGYSADEGFISLVLIATIADFYVDTEAVVIRGFKKKSWSRSDYWTENLNTSMFLTYYFFLKKCPDIKSSVKFLLFSVFIKTYPILKFDLIFFNKLNGMTFKCLYLASFFYSFLRKVPRKIKFEGKRMRNFLQLKLRF